MLTHRLTDILTYTAGWKLLAPRLQARRAARLAEPVQLMVRQVGSWAVASEWLTLQAERTQDRAEATLFRVSGELSVSPSLLFTWRRMWLKS